MTEYIYIDEVPGNPEPDHFSVSMSGGSNFVSLGIFTYDLRETILINAAEARDLARALNEYADQVGQK